VRTLNAKNMISFHVLAQPLAAVDFLDSGETHQGVRDDMQAEAVRSWCVLLYREILVACKPPDGNFEPALRTAHWGRGGTVQSEEDYKSIKPRG
jgi:hypothetical protein